MKEENTMRRFLLALSGLLLAAIISGCAHPISLAGNVASLAGTGTGKLDKAVGLSMSDEDRKREVIGPGGGGDKVSYLPYRDLETGLYIALSETFARVSRVNGLSDPKVKADGLNYVVTPSIATTSFSPSIFTWPPTIFTIELTCKVVDDDGKAVTEVRALGEGRAEFDEFKGDFSLSAKRAADDAFKKLVKALADAKAKFP
jgi:hypothetical protein